MLTHRACAALFVEAVGLVGARSMQPKAAYRAVITDMPECAGDENKTWALQQHCDLTSPF